MPREARVVAVGLPHHITQRGNARQDVFITDSLRRAYLRLLSQYSITHRLRVLGYCLMTNHVHIVAIPETDSSMANTFRHAHGRFSQYWNTEQKRSGHLWQNRYYSCAVEEAAVGRVIAYVEKNPVRAGMVKYAEDFEWSSARAHLGHVTDGPTQPRNLDDEWWQVRWTAPEWKETLLNLSDQEHESRAIREATYTGRPLGSQAFVADLGEKLGRELGTRPGGRPKRDLDRAANQLALWAIR